MAHGSGLGRRSAGGSCRAGAGDPATVVTGPGPRRALLRQGHPRCHARERAPPAEDRSRRHCGARRAHRAWLAVRGPKGRGPGRRRAAQESALVRLSNRRRLRRGPRPPGARGWCVAHQGARRHSERPVRAPSRRPRVSAETPPVIDPVSAEQQQADALALLAETALHHGIEPGASGERSNLTLRCRRHHRAVHEEGYQVERRTDGELIFRHPRGHEIPDVPRNPTVPDDAADHIRVENEAVGLQISAHTAAPAWHGERLDLAYTLDVLYPRRLTSD